MKASIIKTKRLSPGNPLPLKCEINKNDGK
jgi:hypothetical protein